MAEFKPITTQEEFDEAIKARLDRQEKTIAARYSDYEKLKEAAEKQDEEQRRLRTQAQEDAEKIKKLTAELETAKASIKDHETRALKNSIAAEIGLPAGLTDRLTGNTAEEIRKDAEALKAVFDKENRKDLPGFTKEAAPGDATAAAYRQVLSGLHIKE